MKQRGGNEMNKPKLRGKIAENGYSIRSLAPVVNMAAATLSRSVNGDRDLTVAEAAALSRALHIDDMAERAEIFLV